MDLYLLGSDEVLEFACAHRMEKLNHFERALLVERLQEGKESEKAESLTAAMELPLKNQRQSGEEFKRFF